MAAVWMVMVKLVEVVPGMAPCGVKVTVAAGGSPVALRTMGKLNGPGKGDRAKSKVTDLPGATVWPVTPAGLPGCGVSAMLKSSTNWGTGVEVLPEKFGSPE